MMDCWTVGNDSRANLGPEALMVAADSSPPLKPLVSVTKGEIKMKSVSVSRIKIDELNGAAPGDCQCLFMSK